MSASCARCGDCCEAIHLNGTKKDLRGWLRQENTWMKAWTYWRHRPYEGKPDPFPSAAEYGTWVERRVQNARFILKHWHRIPRDEATRLRTAHGAADPTPRGHRYRCDAFDPVTRLCGAHDERPPICRNFPWYEDGPNASDAPTRLNPRCSYWHDIPRDQWAAGITPLESPS